MKERTDKLIIGRRIADWVREKRDEKRKRKEGRKEGRKKRTSERENGKIKG